MSGNRKHVRSADGIRKLLQYPEIFKYVSESRLAFTLKFRTYLWETYGDKPISSDVRNALADLTGDPEVAEIVGSNSINNIAENIRRHGKPKGASNDVFGVRDLQKADPEYSRFLLSEGYLTPSKNGYSFTDKFRLILADRPENQDAKTALKEAGIDPDRIGYQKLMKLIREEEGSHAFLAREELSPDDVKLLRTSPFIQGVSVKSIRYRKEFDQWAARLKKHVSLTQILTLSGLNESRLSPAARLRILNRIRYHSVTEDNPQELPSIPGTQEQILLFLKQYLQILYRETAGSLKTMGSLWKRFDCKDKQKFGQILKETSAFKSGYSVTSLLRACSVPRSSWYGIWTEDYGKQAEKQKRRDQEDAEEIRKICEYRGFRKGSRQVRLQMIRTTGKTISLERVRRLMKENGLSCAVRTGNPARISSRKLLEHSVKPNILSRQFRLNKPGEVILTDVSYLDYGPDRNRAYLSALKDPASGKIHALLVSSSQDTSLSERTLKSLPAPADSALFHSDQGVMYLNPAFQKELKSRGYEQSMSRRGNCWDNSSMESFFGHFKDECPYQDCRTLEELDRLLQDYKEYYNTERPQPCRENRTPVEFEKKLLDMNEEQWAEYQYSEQKKYNKMLEKAAESAIERARTDRAVSRESRYGRKENKEQKNRQKNTAKVRKVSDEKMSQYVIEAADNPYTEEISKDFTRIIYTGEFYLKMKELLDGGMSAVQAYEACGYDTSKLGTKRAEMAAHKARNFSNSDRKYDWRNYSGMENLDEILKEEDPEIMKSRLIAKIKVLEAMDEAQKNSARISGEIYSFGPEAETIETSRAVDCFLTDCRRKEISMTVSSACRLFSISRNTCYSWKKRMDGSSEKPTRLQEDEAVKAMMLEVIARLTWIPGKRRFRDLLLRRFGIRVDTQRISRLMKEMNIEASSSRRKDAYKGLMMNIHPCCALKNYVIQDFYLGCRQIILTDITYIPYGLKEGQYAYLCTFIDPYTKEVLGWKVSDSMNSRLIQEAWNHMMDRHENEFPKDRKFFVHSDQGSQYLAAEIRELLKETAVQSMSRRGNSLDNAPQESFFGRMKNRISNHFPLMKTADQVSRMIDAYMRDYNEEVPQESLGGLTPSLYYTYRMTGIFPADQYFGMNAGQLNDVKSVIRWMQNRAEQAREKRNRQARRNREKYSPDRCDPKGVIQRDIHDLEKRLKSTLNQIRRLEGLKEKIMQVMEDAEKALEYVKTCSEEKIEELSSGTGWDKIPELKYVVDYASVFE